jgi:hypothetical protein
MRRRDADNKIFIELKLRREAMQPPKLADSTVAELLRRAEIDLQGITRTVSSVSAIANERCLKRDLLDVLRTIEQAHFSASHGMSISDAAKLWATLPKEHGRPTVHR